MSLKDYILTALAVGFYLWSAFFTCGFFFWLSGSISGSRVIAFIGSIVALTIVTAIFGEARR